MRLKRHLKTALLSTLMLSCMGASAGFSSKAPEHWFEKVADKALRTNLTEFTRTCFYMPYALMNVGGRKQAALEADSVVEFVKAHPHPSLGIYWKDARGTKSYKSCKEAVSAVESTLETVSQEERGIIEASFRRLQESKKEEKRS